MHERASALSQRLQAKAISVFLRQSSTQHVDSFENNKYLLSDIPVIRVLVPGFLSVSSPAPSVLLLWQTPEGKVENFHMISWLGKV